MKDITTYHDFSHFMSSLQNLTKTFKLQGRSNPGERRHLRWNAPFAHSGAHRAAHFAETELLVLCPIYACDFIFCGIFLHVQNMFSIYLLHICSLCVIRVIVSLCCFVVGTIVGACWRRWSLQSPSTAGLPAQWCSGGSNVLYRVPNLRQFVYTTDLQLYNTLYML